MVLLGRDGLGGAAQLVDVARVVAPERAHVVRQLGVSNRPVDAGVAPIRGRGSGQSREPADLLRAGRGQLRPAGRGRHQGPVGRLQVGGLGPAGAGRVLAPEDLARHRLVGACNENSDVSG